MTIDTVLGRSVNPRIVAILAEAIATAGPHGIPSGHLYAMLIGTLSLAEYQLAIDELKTKKLVVESANVLKIHPRLVGGVA